MSAFDSEFEAVTTFEHCLAVYKRNGTKCVAAENYLLVFKRCHTLDTVFVST